MVASQQQNSRSLFFQGCHNAVLGAVFSGGQECESSGRFRRKRPISYEQLYPSLFSRRRKSSTAKASAVTQLNALDPVESDAVVKLTDGTEDGDSVSSECLPAKKKRKRRRKSITDSKSAWLNSFVAKK